MTGFTIKERGDLSNTCRCPPLQKTPYPTRFEKASPSRRLLYCGIRDGPRGGLRQTKRKRTKKEREQNGGRKVALRPLLSAAFAKRLRTRLPVGRSAGAASPLIPVRRFPGGRVSALAGSVARRFALALSAALRLLVSRVAVHLGVDHAIQILEHKARVYPERLPAVRTRDPEFQLFIGHRS